MLGPLDRISGKLRVEAGVQERPSLVVNDRRTRHRLEQESIARTALD